MKVYHFIYDQSIRDTVSALDGYHVVRCVPSIASRRNGGGVKGFRTTHPPITGVRRAAPPPPRSPTCLSRFVREAGVGNGTVAVSWCFEHVHAHHTTTDSSTSPQKLIRRASALNACVLEI